jgi:hypothetical protein
MIGRPQKKRSETSTVEKERAEMKAPSIAHRNLPRLLGGLLAAACLMLGAFGASPALAAFGVSSFSAEVVDQSNNPYTQAGGHPYQAVTSFTFNTTTDSNNNTIPDENVKDVEVDLPRGFIGNPNAVPKCSAADFGQSQCSRATVVGVITLSASFFGPPPDLNVTTPVYNLEPPKGQAVLFGFNVVLAQQVISATLRADDYGLKTNLTDIAQSLPLYSSSLTFWGVPADPSHDALRGGPAGTPPRPFLRNPTDCSGAQLTTTLKVDSWQHPGDFQTYAATSPPLQGCDLLQFNPSISTKPDNPSADSPTGLSVEVNAQQNENPNGLATPDLKKAVVDLPPGLSLSPAATDGLGACSEAQFGPHNADPVSCPEDSKVGTAKLTTPLLEEPLQGALYLAQQNANPFGSLLAAYLVAEGHGVIIKQAARFDLDPNTGQITASFENVPQLPFSEVALDFFGGPRGVLVNPNGCGNHTYKSTLTSWSGRTVNTTGSFAIDQNCDGGGFNPSLQAGATNPVAGAYAPFDFKVARNDGEQNVAAIGAALPKGELAKLAGVPLCPEANAANGSCPAASRIGQLNVAVGAGPQPLWVPQPGKAPTAMYLAGPYRGEPLSVLFRVPAQAGPFDLGTVAVRAAVHVDPITAQVSVSSDPLPQILQGVPIEYRQIRVGVDRPGFMLNPTSCRETAVASTIVSDAGRAATPASRFQVGDCAGLGFKPRLHTRLLGGTRRGDHPKLRAVLRANPGDANIGRVALTLPHSELFDQTHVRSVCTQAQFAANGCPPGSVYGHAKVWTPLLARPLEGPVHLRSSQHRLPDLVADLHGQVEIELAGRIDTVRGSIRTTFATPPDAPVSAFVLTMRGGKRGLLVNAADTCHGVQRARARFTGYNGRRREFRPRVKADCRGKSHHMLIR